MAERKLDGYRALITGASRGIGRAVAVRFNLFVGRHIERGGPEQPVHEDDGSLHSTNIRATRMP